MDTPGNPPALFRTVLAGLGGGIAWIAAMTVFFGPAQSILADPARQSAKFLAVFGEIEPLPRTLANGWILVVGLLALGVLYGIAYRFVRRGIAGSWWRKGLGFGLLAWILMVPWFEFYLPWNVMHEPFALVLLEGALWLATLSVVGVAIAAIHEWRP
jgi:hypothetical protein